MAEPFAAIPVSWGLSRDMYYKFLMWTAFKMCGADGFDGLEHGQVRFSVREIEEAFDVSYWQARKWVERAKAENLLTPTGKAEKRKGCGEVYNSDGMLAQTRRSSSDQEPIKNRSSKQQKAKALDTSTDQEPIKNRSRTDRLKEETTKTISNTPSLTLRSILQWQEEGETVDYYGVFFKVFDPFPKARKPNMLTLARVFRSVVQSKETTPKELHDACLALLKDRGPKFMPDASRWMNEEGWRAYASRE